MRAAALLAGCLLLAAACRSLPGPLPPLDPGDARPERLLSALDRTASERHALRGRARLDAAGGVLPGSQSLVLVLERPDRLRVEILSFLGQAQAVLTTDAGRYELLIPAERHYESGMLYRGLLWDVAQIDLEPREVVELVLGAPLPDRRLALDRALATPDGGVRLELAGGRGDEHESFVFDAQGRLRRLERSTRGRPPWRVRFDDYAPVDGAPLAHAIALEFERSEARAELSLRDLELNPALPDGLFRLRPPLGAAGGG